MSHAPTEDLNVAAAEVMPPPAQIKAQITLSDEAARCVLDGRAALCRILRREDDRRFVIVGPCSIHDPDAGLDYAKRLRALAREVADTLLIVMRVYFEKPRTSVGWKGFINDPRMDDSFRIAEGMQRARRFLVDVSELGLPAATEALDPIAPQYLGDLTTWTAIGARTSESQTHREMASGLSTPVGFKNGTDGDLSGAINAIVSASRPHSFLGINAGGVTSVIRTRGNAYGHLVLSDCLAQIGHGNRSIVGWMIESNLEWGNQPIPADLSALKYGCSVTDPCVDWTTTETMIRQARDELRGCRIASSDS